MNVKDYLKERYVQNEHNKDLTGNVSAGICFGLCVLWANEKVRSPNNTPKQRINAITSNSMGRKFAIRIQSSWNTNNSWKKEKALWDEKGLTLGKYNDYNIKQITEFSKELINKQRNGSFTALGWYKQVGAGGHQLISYLDNKTFILYDPNGGEFHIPTHTVCDFLKSYWVDLRNEANLPKIGRLSMASIAVY